MTGPKPRLLVFFLTFITILLTHSIGSSASPFTVDESTVHVNGGFVGIRTSTPTTALDVNGDAQFGFGANKSTFTATGGLQLNYGLSAATASFTSSVSASSAALSATGSSIYALTSSTGIHVLNGRIKLESGSYVEWADGTKSTTATSGGGGGASGSYSEICADLTGVVGGASDNLRIGIAGSTLTVTTNASTTTVHWMASVADNTGGCTNSNQMAISFLVDGNFVSPMTATIACTAGGVMGASGGCAAMYCRWPLFLSAGSHTFAATWDNVSGGNSNTPRCAASAACRFCVETH